MTVDGGRLDWTAVKKAFQADVVQIVNEGIPPCFQAGESTGLDHRTFADPELRISVIKRGDCSSTHVMHCSFLNLLL